MDDLTSIGITPSIPGRMKSISYSWLSPTLNSWNMRSYPSDASCWATAFSKIIPSLIDSSPEISILYVSSSFFLLCPKARVSRRPVSSRYSLVLLASEVSEAATLGSLQSRHWREISAFVSQSMALENDLLRAPFMIRPGENVFLRVERRVGISLNRAWVRSASLSGSFMKSLS